MNTSGDAWQDSIQKNARKEGNRMKLKRYANKEGKRRLVIIWEGVEVEVKTLWIGGAVVVLGWLFLVGLSVL